MSSVFIEITGYLAGILIVVSLVPQVIQSWRTKSTHDISLWRYVLYTIGLFLFTTYGVFIYSAPLVVTNSVATVLAIIILGFKLRYK